MTAAELRNQYLLRQACEVVGAQPQSRTDIALAIYDAIPVLQRLPHPPHGNIEDMRALLADEFSADILSGLMARQARSTFRIV